MTSCGPFQREVSFDPLIYVSPIWITFEKFLFLTFFKHPCIICPAPGKLQQR